VLWLRRKTPDPPNPDCFFGVAHNRLYRIPVIWAIEWAQGAKLRNEPSGLRDAIAAWANQVQREERNRMTQKEKAEYAESLVRIAAQGERVVEAREMRTLDDEVVELGRLIDEHNERFGETE
jgi:hypothetical protein